MFLESYAKEKRTTIYELARIMGIPRSTAYKFARSPERLTGLSIARLEDYFNDPQTFRKYRRSIKKLLG